ncbi:MAG: hypothetical protein AVDCRST_MAG59-1127 [uncultured Thermomicrobiales bacterium]|uniref:Putative restriction endonuclease domain-containing protein n=1 Tax=uncultured Thermomicrobiales bacterium TaxID=1645740 RepID=A0A6J4U9T5_9BACT|nr:MAG: hypothetical protein AVDCRST_MAG59-1127 [uncultured Thermomicrobiales bacterium]
MATTVRLTADDLATLPDDGWRYELIRGELERMPPDNAGHGNVTQQLLLPLLPFVHSQRLGTVWVNVGFTLEHDPDTVLGPDVSFVRADRLPVDDRPAFPTMAPDLAVEILSPFNRAGEMARKLVIYLAAGVPLVWFIDKRTRSVAVHTSTGAALLTEGDTLDGGDVLPGFAIPVADLFA